MGTKLEELRNDVIRDLQHRLDNQTTKVKLLEKSWARNQQKISDLTNHITHLTDRCSKKWNNLKFCKTCEQREFCRNGKEIE